MSSFELHAVDKDSLDSTIVGRFTEIEAKDAAKKYASDNNLKITRGVQLVTNYSGTTSADDYRYTFLVTPKASSVSKSKSVARGKRRTSGKRSAKKRSVRRLR